MKIRNDIRIPRDVRQLLSGKEIRDVVADLYRNLKKNDNDLVSVYLPLANKRFLQICEDPYHQGSDRIDQLCFSLDDTKLLKALEKQKVIIIKGITEDEDDEGNGTGFIAGITISEPEYIRHLHNWAKDFNLIVNYGVFSLHSFTGEVYCMDNKYIFHTGRGLFRVFLEFLTEPTHILTYRRIYDLFQRVEGADFDNFAIHQIVGEIREKLHMTGKLSELLVTAGDRYLLKPEL